jgi:hypothetical protein
MLSSMVTIASFVALCVNEPELVQSKGWSASLSLAPQLMCRIGADIIVQRNASDIGLCARASKGK